MLSNTSHEASRLIDLHQAHDAAMDCHIEAKFNDRPTIAEGALNYAADMRLRYLALLAEFYDVDPESGELYPVDLNSWEL